MIPSVSQLPHVGRKTENRPLGTLKCKNNVK